MGLYCIKLIINHYGLLIFNVTTLKADNEDY